VPLSATADCPCSSFSVSIFLVLILSDRVGETFLFNRTGLLKTIAHFFAHAWMSTPGRVGQLPTGSKSVQYVASAREQVENGVLIVGCPISCGTLPALLYGNVVDLLPLIGVAL
jgi:hypothetical protein